jgi:hypothetical protein
LHRDLPELPATTPGSIRRFLATSGGKAKRKLPSGGGCASLFDRNTEIAMTDAVSHPAAFQADAPAGVAAPGRPAIWRASFWLPALLVVVVATAATAGLLAGSAHPSLPDSDAELAMLLRFMAGVKAVLALAALGVTTWRLGHPASSAVALLYLAAVALMCAAPGVIWQLAYVGIGAGLFHAGLLLFLGALFADRVEAAQLVGTALHRARGV